MSIFDKLTGRVVDFFDDVLLPDDLRVYLVRARKAINAERFEEALSHLAHIDARKPGIAKVRQMQGLALTAMGDYNGAITALRDAAALRPDAETFYRLALALEASGAPRDARDALRAAAGLDPQPALAFEIGHGLGRVYRAMRRPDKAIHELRKALRLRDDGAEAIPWHMRVETTCTLARALSERGAFDEARDALEGLRTSAGVDPLEDDVYVLLGYVLLELGDVGAALELLEPRAERDHEAAALAARAALRGGALDAERARQVKGWLERALVKTGEGEQERRAELMVGLGTLALAASSPKAALDHLDAALDLAPRDKGVLTLASEVHLAAAEAEPDARGAHLARAESFLVQLRDIVGEDGALYVSLGRCRLAMGDHPGARRFLSRAQALGQGGDALLTHLATAHMRGGEPAQALVCLEKLEGGGGGAASALQAEARHLLAPPMSLEDEGLPAIRELIRALSHRASTTRRLLPILGPLQDIVEMMERPLSLAVLGEFNAGKSTLVNTIMGESVVPTGVLPTTAHINVMRFGTRRHAELHLTDGRVDEVDFPDVKRRVKREAHTIDHIEYLYPHPDLRRVHIWDTPGFNALDEAHEAHAARALATAEAIVWVCDASQPLTDSEMQRLATIHDGADRLVLVLNKVDRFGDAEARAEAVATIKAHICAHLDLETVGGIFPLSAVEALAARVGDDAAGLERSGGAALLAFLQTEVYDRAGKLKAIEARRALGRALDTLADEGERARTQLEAIAGDVEGLRGEVEVEREAFVDETIPATVRSLADQVSFLLTVLSRELNEALRPSRGLMGTLLTRVELADEDVEFICELALERFGQLLDRSLHRTNANLHAFEEHLADRITSLGAGLDAGDAQTLLARLSAYTTGARATRVLLAQRVYERYRLLAQGKLTGATALELVRSRAARPNIGDAERIDALGALLPDVAQHLEADLEAWALEYFDAARRFCDIVRDDLMVMATETRATTFTINGLR